MTKKFMQINDRDKNKEIMWEIIYYHNFHNLP